MHSRIFQIDRKSIKNFERISSGDIPEWFTNTIADYVDDDTDRKADIEWLMTDALGSISTVKSSKLTFSSDISKYFDDKYYSFVDAAKMLAGVNIDDFISAIKIRSAVFNLTEAFNEKYGFYVYIDDELLTLDEFVRSVKPGETYYIGSTVDYHY